MPIEINITGADAAEALRELAKLSGGLVGGDVPVAPVAPAAPAASVTPEAAPVEKPKRQRAAKSEATAAKEVEDSPAESQEPETDATEDVGEPGQHIPTDVELRDLGVKVSKKHGSAAIKKLLGGFGVVNITALPDDKRPAFAAALQGLLDGETD